MGTLAAGIKDIFATAKTTGSNVMLCGNDGTPDGHMTMANLASVLGVNVGIVPVSHPGDKTIEEVIKWIVSSYPNNSFMMYQGNWSSPTTRGFFIVATGTNSINQNGLPNYATCIFKRVASDKQELTLVNIYDGVIQKDYCSYSIPSFYKDYNSLASLASALGVTKRMEFVDLGLPSGTLWATRNLGAETPEDYGYYFSWGNVIGRKPNGTTFDYDWGTNNDGNYASTPGAALTGDIPTNMDYDAVQRYMGGSCKMPEKNQFVELFNSSYTTNEWTTKNGVNGLLVTSKINGNSVFFPAAGYGSGTSLSDAGSYGDYWSRSLYSSANGYYLGFNSSSVIPQNYYNRFNGFSVRAVQ